MGWKNWYRKGSIFWCTPSAFSTEKLRASKGTILSKVVYTRLMACRVSWPLSTSRISAYSERPVLYSQDRKSTRLNSSHVRISYAVFCLNKKYDRVRELQTHQS